MRNWLVVASVAGALTCEVATWRTAFESYWRAYPKAEAADLYKVAHQGIMGSEHAVGDSNAVRTWMQREVAGLSANPEPPPYHAALVEPLPPNGRFVRIHLRPYMARGGSLDALTDAFIATANSARGDTAEFSCAVRALTVAATARDTRAVVALFRAQQKLGYNAVHHSEQFAGAYVPAYRVVDSAGSAQLTRRLRPR